MPTTENTTALSATAPRPMESLDGRTIDRTFRAENDARTSRSVGNAQSLSVAAERPVARLPRSFCRTKHMRTWLVVGMAVFALGLAACGGSSNGGSGSGNSAPHVHFAKTKFLLHAGLAFGAFHRYIYKPFRNGQFTPPLKHKLAIVKAGVAALFAYHEIKIALVDAQSSAALSKLVSPLTALQTRLRSLGQHLHNGQLNPSALTGANGVLNNISALGAKSGAPIHDLASSLAG